MCPTNSLRKNLTSRVALLRRLAGSGWGVGATTLRTATLAMVHRTAEYCAPVWCRSAHIRLIDPTINDDFHPWLKLLLCNWFVASTYVSVNN